MRAFSFFSLSKDILFEEAEKINQNRREKTRRKVGGFFFAETDKNIYAVYEWIESSCQCVHVSGTYVLAD